MENIALTETRHNSIADVQKSDQLYNASYRNTIVKLSAFAKKPTTLSNAHHKHEYLASGTAHVLDEDVVLGHPEFETHEFSHVRGRSLKRKTPQTDPPIETRPSRSSHCVVG